MSSEAKKSLILIDGSSYLYRAFHALPPLTNSKGMPTGAIYGVLNMIRKLLKDNDPIHAAVIFDAKGKTFRDELFADYKATRAAMPDDLISQTEPLQNIITAMGIPLLIIDGVEADDVIGTLAKEAEKNGIDTLISTGDKDMAQLVNEQITLINTMSNTILDRIGVIEKFGVPPELIIDYLALIGDSVDNIPGIPKVGPKTAAKWLTEYGSLANIVANADKISGVVGENLRTHLPNLALSQQLATIKCDVPLQQHVTDLTLTAPNKALLIDYFREFEFKTWLAELLQEDEQQNPTVKKEYQIILSEADFSAWIKEINTDELLAFSLQTNSNDYLHAKIIGMSLATNEHNAIYIPLAHDYLGAPHQLTSETVLAQLKPILENPNHKKIAHDLKNYLHILQTHGITLRGFIADCMLESYVLNSAASRHDSETLALKYLGFKPVTYEDVAGKGAKQVAFNTIAIDTAATHSAESVDLSLRLHQNLWPKIQALPGLKYVLEEIEVPLISVLANVERNGVLIDEEKLHEQGATLAKRLFELENEAYDLANQSFNLNSPKQLQEILYQKLELPILQKTPTGQASTSEEVLQELALSFALPKIILEYRSLSKLKSTYIDALPKQINPVSGRVHTSYNQAVAATGRLSSTDPNLQNIPIRNEEGRKIRQAFIAPKGYKIVAADYSQIELRIMAHLSKDKGLLHAFANDLDIHIATAAEVFGIALDKVSHEQRRSAKAINFGLIYGMSAFGLAKQINATPDIAKKYMDLYFQHYPGVKLYMETTRKEAHAQGFVETLFGRRLYLAEINSKNLQRQRAAERAAINAPMQGTAADIIKRAMIAVDQWLQESKIDARMIMQVHDELVFEVAENSVPELISNVKNLMMQTSSLTVPLVVEAGVGDNWDEAH